MSYKALYDFCQTLTPDIKRNLIRDKVLELTRTPKISVVRTDMDVSMCRGYFLSAQNTEHALVRQLGANVIVLAREGNNHCYERFVFVKELMHLFDKKEEATDNGDIFERVLTELVPGADMKPSPQTTSERKGVWMALGALCPEQYRLNFAKEREANRTDDYAIALKLRIPKQYVPLLFQPRYLTNINSVISGSN